MNLRKVLTTALLAIVCLTPAFSSAAAQPRFIFDPISAQARQCSTFGPAWRKRILEALRLAQARTKNLLPAESWSQLLLSATTVVEPTKLQAEACETFIRDYSDPMLSQRIRGPIVIGLLIKSVTGCAAEFPQLAAQFRAAWISAFTRNGFDPEANFYDESVLASWRKPTNDQRQRQSCEESLHFLSGSEFDKFASERSIKNFLSPPQ